MPKAYYNEFDPYSAQWLRNLISAGHIAAGDVDERSIADVGADDLKGYTQCHFFAGIGGWSLAARLAGWPDDRPLWTGSCPCQPFSVAGKGKGQKDERHLWPVFFELIRTGRPDVVMGEQVASPDGLSWLDIVSADLEGASYAFRAADICAASVGSPIPRPRLWFVAQRLERPGSIGWERRQEAVPRNHNVGQASVWSKGQHGARVSNSHWDRAEWIIDREGCERPIEPGTFPLAHGVPGRVGKLRAYGNAIVPQVAAEIIGAFMDAYGLPNDAG